VRPSYDNEAFTVAINKVQDTTAIKAFVFVLRALALTRKIYVGPASVLSVWLTALLLCWRKNTPGSQKGPAYWCFSQVTPRRIQISESEIKGGATVLRRKYRNVYSGESNIDIEIQEGKSGDAGVRARLPNIVMCPHGFISAPPLREFTTAEKSPSICTFTARQYGIGRASLRLDGNSPSSNSTFEGETQAAIREHEDGRT